MSDQDFAAAASRFVNIGERTNVTGSARFKKLVMAGDYPAAVEVARLVEQHRAREERAVLVHAELALQALVVHRDEGLPQRQHARRDAVRRAHRR